MTKKITTSENSNPLRALKPYKHCISSLTEMITKNTIESKKWSNHLNKLREYCDNNKIDWNSVSLLILEDLETLRSPYQGN